MKTFKSIKKFFSAQQESQQDSTSEISPLVPVSSVPFGGLCIFVAENPETHSIIETKLIEVNGGTVAKSISSEVDLVVVADTISSIQPHDIAKIESHGLLVVKASLLALAVEENTPLSDVVLREVDNICVGRERAILWNEVIGGSTALDFTFVLSDGSNVQCHRHILSQKCEFFKAMFGSSMADSSSQIMTVDHSRSALLSLLQFLYLGMFENPLLLDCCSEIYQMGKFYGVPSNFREKILSKTTSETFLSMVETVCLMMCDNKEEYCCLPGKFSELCCKFTQNPYSLEILNQDSVIFIINSAAEYRGQWQQRSWELNGLKLVSEWTKIHGADFEQILCCFPFEKVYLYEFERALLPSGLIPQHLVSPLKERLIPTRDYSKLTNAPLYKFEYSGGYVNGLAFSSFNQCFYASEWSQKKISVFDIQGNSKFSFGPDQLTCPASLAISEENGNVFVCDRDSNFVRVFDPLGNLLFSFNEAVKSPQDVAVDSARKELHMCDRELNCVNVYTFQGDFLRTYAKEDPGKIVRPSGIAIDEKQQIVYVSEQTRSVVNFFDLADGTFLGCFGGDSSFSQESYKLIAVHPKSGHIAVTDYCKGRVQVFTAYREWVGEVSGFPNSSVSAVAFGPHDELLLACIPQGESNWKILAF